MLNWNWKEFSNHVNVHIWLFCKVFQFRCCVTLFEMQVKHIEKCKIFTNQLIMKMSEIHKFHGYYTTKSMTQDWHVSNGVHAFSDVILVLGYKYHVSKMWLLLFYSLHIHNTISLYLYLWENSLLQVPYPGHYQNTRSFLLLRNKRQISTIKIE
jgi:hypothetical protein